MAWYNASWTYRQKVTIDATKVDEVFSVFPLYTSKLNMHFFDTAKAAAADVRITSSDGTTEVARYIVTHDATNRLGCILINVSASISISTDTDFYVYYGNAAASDHAVTATYGRDNALNSYAGFYLPGMSTADLTGGGRTLTTNHTTAASGYEGITAAEYNGTTQYDKYEGTQAVTDWNTSGLTMEGLAYNTINTTLAAVVSLSDVDVVATANSNALLAFGGTSAGDPSRFYSIGASGGNSSAFSSTGFTTSTWHYLAGKRTANTGTSTAYIDGASAGTNSSTLTSPSLDRLSIGANIGSTITNRLTGRVAMAALSSSVRSADFIATMYDAWSSSTFFTAGAIETETGGMTGWVLFQTAATTSDQLLDRDWTNPNNAYSVNADAATAIVDDAVYLYTETLKLTNPAYGITIPSGETTYGCKFRVLRSGQTNSAKEIRDKLIKFIDNTSAVVGTDMKAGSPPVWPATAASVDYTGAGVTFTDAKFTSSSGLAIQADGSGSNGDTTASVVTAWINVTWDTPAGGGNTGTGALTAPAGTVAGAGIQTLDGTGALTAPVGTVSGAGITGRTGTGALIAPVATLSGAGITGKTGTGAISAPAATVSGAGTQIIDGTGAITAPAGTLSGSGTGTGSIPVTGTGALDAPMPSVSGNGDIISGNQTLVGALTAPAGAITGSAITGKTGTAALVHPMPIVAGSGRSTVSGTGALVAPDGYVIAGIGLNSPPGHVGTAALTAPAGVISGTGYVLGATDLSVEYLSWYTTGASDVGRSQRSQAASLGGNRSSTEAKLMTWECRDPMVGVEILAVSALNGRGNGSLAAVTESTLSWTPPGGTEGTAVTLASGDESLLFGFDTDAWIRVRRISTIPMSGAHSVQCLDIYNNLVGMGNVASADAVTGKTYYRSIMAHNPFAGPAINIKVWLDSAANDNIAIGYEAAVAGAIQTIASETTAPTGITWSTGTTSATGLTITSLEGGADLGIWIKRTIAAASAPSPSELVHVHIEYEDLATETHNDDLRGKYRIARDSYVTYGLWLGQDAEPDLTGAADVQFASRPYTTTLNYDEGHTYNAVIRQRNKWGLWSQNATSTPLVMLAGGGQGFVPPTAPTDILATQTADDEAIVSGRYEPVVDTALAVTATNDPGRAEIFVLWMTTDNSAPDVTDPPTAYQLMGRRAGVEIFKYTDTGNSLLDGTPIKAIVRTRRLTIGSGDAFSPDTTQLPASGAGTIVVASELAGWASSGYMKVTSFSGALQEVVAYSALVVGTGISTFTVGSGGRAQWGTTAAATATNTVIYPVTSTDSTNTTVATGTIDGIAPGRPWGEVFFGNKDAQAQDPIAGPDGVTEQYIDVTDNIYLLLGEGWTELWMDTDLVWKVFQDGTNYADNALYIPSEWTIVTGSVSGASTGVFDAPSATSLYIVSGGVRRVHINTAAMTITMPTLSTLGGLPEVAPQVASWEQYAGSLLQSWDPARSDYRPYVQVSSAGTMTSEWLVDNTLTQAEIVAL